jgi:hypothetical protein
VSLNVQRVRNITHLYPSSPTIPNSPAVLFSEPSPRTQPRRTGGPSSVIPAKTTATPGPFKHASPQYAQVPSMLSATQDSTPEITIIEDSENEGTLLTPEDEKPHSPHSSLTPRKKLKLDNYASRTQSQKRVRPGVSKIAAQSPQKMVVFPVAYTPQSAFLTPTPAKTPTQTPAKGSPCTTGKRVTRGRTTKAPTLKQESAARPTARVNENSIQSSQSQTVQILRRSARNLGPNAPTDTQHVELGADSVPRPVSFPRKAPSRSQATPSHSKADVSRSRGAASPSKAAPGLSTMITSPSKAVFSPLTTALPLSTAVDSPLKAPAGSLYVPTSLLTMPNLTPGPHKKRKRTKPPSLEEPNWV